MFIAVTNAHASKARLESLNQDPSGSYFISDTRNIFLNPAQLTVMKPQLNFEWGKKGRPGVADDIPENEGGFIISLGAGKLAAQLGQVSRFDKLVREVNSNVTDVSTNVAGGNFGEGQNNINVMYALNSQWGFGVTLTRSKTALTTPGQQSSVQAVDLRAGMLNDGFEAFGSVLVGAFTRTDLASGSGELSEPLGIEGGFGGKTLKQGRQATINVATSNRDHDSDSGPRSHRYPKAGRHPIRRYRPSRDGAAHRRSMSSHRPH